MTISRALNNKPNVKEKTKDIILKVAEELNYTPNAIARSLIKKKTNTLGVVLFDISDTFFAEILNGIEKVSRKNNYNILLCNANYDPDIELQSIKILLEKRIDGLLICPTQKNNKYVDLLKTMDIPFVLLNRRTNLIKCDYVVNDYIYGAYIAINYLIKKEYKDIYFIYSNKQTSTCNERIRGCKKAFIENKISLKKLKLFYCERNIDSFYDFTLNNVKYSGERIGIFVWNDNMSFGAYRAIVEMGLRIPEDVGLIGYDNIKISKYFPKPLTTINNPSYEIGIKATKLLISKIESRNSKKIERIVIKPELIIRNSA